MNLYKLFAYAGILVSLAIVAMIISTMSRTIVSVNNDFVHSSLKESWHVMIYNNSSEHIELLHPHKIWGTYYRFKPTYSLNESVWINDPSLVLEDSIMFAQSNQDPQDLGISEDEVYCIYVRKIDNSICTNILKHDRRIYSPAMSLDRRYVVYISKNERNEKTLFLYDRENNEKITIVIDTDFYYTGRGLSLSWGPDSDIIYFSTYEGHVLSYDINTSNMETIIQGYAPICAPTGKHLLLRTGITTPYEYNIYDLESNRITDFELANVRNVAWSPDGKHILAVRTKPTFKDGIASILFGERVLRTVILVDFATGREREIYRYYGNESLDCKAVNVAQGF